ncbi:hypothetical protein, partial [Streptococcus suis]|uniref:hypothetical protein n=1 Tax=Streptococcus suis TaxID=1307 RepID=UPI0005CEDFD6
LPPPHSSNCLGDSWKLEIERTKFATKLSGRQFEVGDEANSVRISRRGQIWSVKHEQICQSTTALRC